MSHTACFRVIPGLFFDRLESSVNDHSGYDLSAELNSCSAVMSSEVLHVSLVSFRSLPVIGLSHVMSQNVSSKDASAVLLLEGLYYVSYHSVALLIVSAKIRDGSSL